MIVTLLPVGHSHLAKAKAAQAAEEGKKIISEWIVEDEELYIMMNTNVFLGASFFISLSVASVLGMQQSENPFFNKKEAAFNVLNDCLIDRHIPKSHLVIILKRLRNNIIMAYESGNTSCSVQLRTFGSIADFFDSCRYWAFVKKAGLEEEKIALLIAEEQGTLDQTALKNYRTKRSLLYEELSQVEANALHKKTLIDSIDQLLELLTT